LLRILGDYEEAVQVTNDDQQILFQANDVDLKAASRITANLSRPISLLPPKSSALIWSMSPKCPASLPAKVPAA
jgi:hypothetical protein